MRGVGVPPWAASIDGRFPCLFAWQSSASQLSFPSFETLPCPPDQFAQMPANVNVDTFEDLFPIVQRVIGSPSAQDHRQGLDRSQEGSSATSTQSCKARLSDTRRPRCSHERISEKFGLRRTKETALAVIHPQFERSLYELTRLFQYTIPGLQELTNRLPSTAYLQKLNPRPSKRLTYTL